VDGNLCAGCAAAQACSAASLSGIFFRDDLADEGLELGWVLRDLQGLAKHGFRFVEERDVFAEESDEGLALFYFVA